MDVEGMAMLLSMECRGRNAERDDRRRKKPVVLTRSSSAGGGVEEVPDVEPRYVAARADVQNVAKQAAAVVR